MAFLAEDGTGLAAANALCAVAFADEYFTDRGVTSWTGASSAKEAALIRATDYVETRWGKRFKGRVQFPDTPQALSFPRLGIDSDGAVPVAIQKAVAEYALRALSGTALAPDPVYDTSGRQSVMTRKKVGPIETEQQYTAGASAVLFRPYPMADALVRPLLAYDGLVRA